MVTPQDDLKQLMLRLYRLSKANGYACVIAVQYEETKVNACTYTKGQLNHPMLAGLACHLANALKKWKRDESNDISITE